MLYTWLEPTPLFCSIEESSNLQDAGVLASIHCWHVTQRLYITFALNDVWDLYHVVVLMQGIQLEDLHSCFFQGLSIQKLVYFMDVSVVMFLIGSNMGSICTSCYFTCFLLDCKINFKVSFKTWGRQCKSASLTLPFGIEKLITRTASSPEQLSLLVRVEVLKGEIESCMLPPLG